MAQKPIPNPEILYGNSEWAATPFYVVDQNAWKKVASSKARKVWIQSPSWIKWWVADKSASLPKRIFRLLDEFIENAKRIVLQGTNPLRLTSISIVRSHVRNKYAFRVLAGNGYTVEIMEEYVPLVEQGDAFYTNEQKSQVIFSKYGKLLGLLAVCDVQDFNSDELVALQAIANRNEVNTDCA